jgi:hypothetical protein
MENAAQTQKRKSRQRLIIIGAIVLIIGLIVLYFLTLRTPDSTYDSAQKAVASLQNDSKTIATIASTDTTAAVFSETNVKKIQTAATDYQKALTSLGASPAVSRDSNVRSSYNQYKSTLTKYSQAAMNLAVSATLYRQTAATCGQLITAAGAIPTQTMFDTAARDCKALLIIDASSSNSTFKDKLLSPYSTNTSTLLTAVRDYIGAKATGKVTPAVETAVTSATKSLASLANQKQDYSLSPNSTAALSSLSSVISSQKSALIR